MCMFVTQEILLRQQNIWCFKTWQRRTVNSFSKKLHWNLYHIIFIIQQKHQKHKIGTICSEYFEFGERIGSGGCGEVHHFTLNNVNLALKIEKKVIFVGFIVLINILNNYHMFYKRLIYNRHACIELDELFTIALLYAHRLHCIAIATIYHIASD